MKDRASSGILFVDMVGNFQYSHLAALAPRACQSQTVPETLKLFFLNA
jgi:hypothetical protein